MRKNFLKNSLTIFYILLSVAVLPLVFLLIIYRLLNKKELPQRWQEKFAIVNNNFYQNFYQNSQKSTLIWLHAVSVGEINSAFWFIEQLLKKSQCHILLTSTTTTSAKIIADKITQNTLFNERVCHQFLPFDSYYIVKKFLQYWQPKMAIFIESEIWPNILWQLKKKAVPTFLVNAKISPKTYNFWRFLQKNGLDIFANFTAIFAQSKTSYELLQKLFTNPKLYYYGNLKCLVFPVLFDSSDLLFLQQNIDKRKCFVASNTHKTEEEIIIKIHQNLVQKFSDLLTIIIIRHPQRKQEVLNLIGNNEIVAVRSLQQKITKQTQFYLVDTIGEVQLLYSYFANHFVFMGGSFALVGGHNPCEAILHNCAVLSGKNVANNQQIYHELIENNACFLVENQNQLQQQVQYLLENNNICKKTATKAKEWLNNQNQQQKIIEIILQELKI
jgi:3-deoxy-D-manno-octulosonic-acid transferase